MKGFDVAQLGGTDSISYDHLPVGEIARSLYRIMCGSWWNTLDNEPIHVQEMYIREARRFVEMTKAYATPHT